ncbi:MAG: hypothetical protein IJI34_03250 [Clostridia bacterium]|nr:hypothetical protein [Clostridia bacterium]
MKMTRLEWRYLQRIALDHPYYDTHKPPLSDAEARAIMEANNTMTGREFVDSIYAKLGMTRPVKEKKHFAWLSNIGELFTVPPIRKIAIAILVAVLMTVFFTATPTGRAIAESVIQYITTLFDDGRITVNEKDNETPVVPLASSDNIDISEQQNGEVDHMFIRSFDDFIEITGETPIIMPLPCTELYYIYDYDIDYLELHSTYETSNGKIIAYQIWNVESIVSSTLTGYSVYDTENDTDNTIYYSIEENGSIVIKMILEDSYFGITSKGDYELKDLIEMIMK